MSVAPQVPFQGLETLWVQITGTLCNLTCTHCFISCSPDNHTLEFMPRRQIRGYVEEAAELGVKEIYFTGGEPFLHPDVFDILEDSLAVAPTAVLTNGVLITERFATRLATLSAASPYSLEIRVSLDAPDEEANDAIRGAGVFRKALRGVRRLHDAGLMPIVTACELVAEEQAAAPAPAAGNLATTECDATAECMPIAVDGPAPGGACTAADHAELPDGVDPLMLPPKPGDDRFYRRFYDLLRATGIERPRVKILPVFNMGMLEGRDRPALLTNDDLVGFDTGNLQCSAARLVAHDGVYACPILAGEPAARLSDDGLKEALEPCTLYHPSCTTCYVTGMTCRNY